MEQAAYSELAVLAQITICLLFISYADDTMIHRAYTLTTTVQRVHPLTVKKRFTVYPSVVTWDDITYLADIPALLGSVDVLHVGDKGACGSR